MTGATRGGAGAGGEAEHAADRGEGAAPGGAGQQVGGCGVGSAPMAAPGWHIAGAQKRTLLLRGFWPVEFGDGWKAARSARLRDRRSHSESRHRQGGLLVTDMSVDKVCAAMAP